MLGRQDSLVSFTWVNGVVIVRRALPSCHLHFVDLQETSYSHKLLESCYLFLFTASAL